MSPFLCFCLVCVCDLADELLFLGLSPPPLSLPVLTVCRPLLQARGNPPLSRSGLSIEPQISFDKYGLYFNMPAYIISEMKMSVEARSASQWLVHDA